MEADFSLLVAAWCAFALVCGGLIKGALGVGTPLLTVPMMAMVIPPQMAVAIMAVPVVVANLWQVSQAPRVTNVVGRFWPTFIAILVGTWFGVRILATLDDSALLMVVGIAVIVFALLQGSTLRIQIPPAFEKPAGTLFGLASGLIGGVSSFFGPMLITYLVSLPNLSKDAFVGSISFLYVGAVVPWTLTLIYFGVLDGPLLVYSALAALPVVVGMGIGQRLRARISEDHFRKLVLLILLSSGGIILWRAFQ